MGLSDQIKRRVTSEMQNEKADALIRKNMNAATSTLMEKFLHKVKAGEVEIQDIRDLKDVFTIYKEVNDITQLLEQANSGAPQVSLQINNVFNKQLGTTDIIDQESGTIEQIDISDEIAKLTSEDVAKMASERDKAKNEENESKW